MANESLALGKTGLLDCGAKYVAKIDGWFAAIEKILGIFAVAGLAALVAVQAGLFCDATRPYFSLVDRLEGVSIPNDAGLSAPPARLPRPKDHADVKPASNYENLSDSPGGSRELTVRMLSPLSGSKVRLILNGRPAADFSRQEVKLAVEEGDVLEIDARQLEEKARFVVRVPPDIVRPADGQVFETDGSAAKVGKITFQH